MTRPADSAAAPRLPFALGVAGLGSLAVITLVYPGSTRMFASPWSLAYAGALLAPVLILLARAFDRRRPLVLPAPLWTFTALAGVGVLLVSAGASPWPGPSLLGAAPLLAAIATFFVLHDLRARSQPDCPRFDVALGLVAAAVVLTSLGAWLASLPGRSLASVVAARNPFPLGHSNYTAGAALFALPWCGVLAWRARGGRRIAWAALVLATLVVLASSGSRAAIPALAAMGLAALLGAPWPWRRKLAWGLALPLAALALAAAHPRTRAMFVRADPSAAPNVSNVQRAAMLTAAGRMGADRPALGYGPGTTPLAYPRYRAGLDGGAENVLQLHSTPAQVWAELGAAGLAVAVLLGALTIAAARRAPVPSPAVLAVAGYAVFAVADWQLDVPFFGFALAAALAALAPTAPAPAPGLVRGVGLTALLGFGVIVGLGRPDPTPALNARALALACTGTPAGRAEAVALLRRSLAANPDQEIAHFNLGWLLVVDDPVAAERHFIEALHLVPDKGGVYFGLGLARLNQQRPADAAAAFALEALNEPAFLFSPWWREPALAAQVPAARRAFAAVADAAARKLPRASWAAAQVPAVAALAPRLGEVPAGPVVTGRRERTGYPVLVRDLDLAPPHDLYEVRELPPAALRAATSTPLPPKGWLPGPLLLELLDTPLRVVP